MFSVQKFAPYNFKNFHAFKIERILQKTALVREVADVGEALPRLTDTQYCSRLQKVVISKFFNKICTV